MQGIGMGGNIGSLDSFLTIHPLPEIFPDGCPDIATSAVTGILLNLIFLVLKPPQVRPMVGLEMEAGPAD